MEKCYFRKNLQVRAYSDCFEGNLAKDLSPKTRLVVRQGSFYRKSDRKRILRFKCRRCLRTFSQATHSACFAQKKRVINDPVMKLLVSGVSQRRIAKLLGVNLKTVARKLVFLGEVARKRRCAYIAELSASPEKLTDLQFDELETIERTKCLPVSVPLVVHAKSRKVIHFKVGKMPAKGPLAAFSKKKYGRRLDERPKIIGELFSEISNVVDENAEILTDQNPMYPKWIRNHFPKARHKTTPGLRGCIAGQGELKKARFDPLFSLNHSCAMLRANINRLFRRTWCVTKRIDRLLAHLEIYVQFHNEVLTIPKKRLIKLNST